MKETDMRIVPHAYHCIFHSYKQIVVTSHDSDVFTLFLFYKRHFLQKGLIEIWPKFGTSANTEYLTCTSFV